MTKSNKKILIVGICAITAITIAIIVATITMHKTSIDDSFFVTDSTKYVIALNDDEINLGDDSIKPTKGYVVYYRKGDTITDMKEYYLFNQEADAKTLLEQIKADNTSNYKAMITDGKYLILTANASKYAGKTAEEIEYYIDLLNNTKSEETNNDEFENTEEHIFDEEGNEIESENVSAEEDL